MLLLMATFNPVWILPLTTAIHEVVTPVAPVVGTVFISFLRGIPLRKASALFMNTFYYWFFPGAYISEGKGFSYCALSDKK